MLPSLNNRPVRFRFTGRSGPWRSQASGLHLQQRYGVKPNQQALVLLRILIDASDFAFETWLLVKVYGKHVHYI